MHPSAQGSIAHPTDQSFVEELGRGARLRATSEVFPANCIDGRPSQTALPDAPASAGGTIGLWVADQLHGSPAEDYSSFASRIKSAGHPVGGHTGGDSPTASGCGAADHLDNVLSLLRDHPDTIREIVASWGGDPTLLDEHMLAAAGQLQAPSGPELLSETASIGTVTHLEGSHHEEAAVINLRPQTTRNPSERQTFHVDVWSFPLVADAVGSPHPARWNTALCAFNAAALLLLAAPAMPAIVVS